MIKQLYNRNKYAIIILAMGLIFAACQGPDKEPDTKENREATLYDSITAAEYGADDYGMKRYVMAFLYRGENRDLTKERMAELQQLHLINIRRMAEEGDLVVAGPFLDTGDLRGIYIFDVSTIEEAEKLVNTDPAITEGSLRMELKEWYGTAALMGVNKLHSKLQKINITE